MSDFNVQGRPIKRKRDPSCNRAGSGSRDGDEMMKDLESHGQQLPKLQRLDDKNPVLAEQAARLVALYRRLWESYVTKHANSSRLERENHQLQLAHSRLTDEKSHLEHHCREQEARSSHFQEAFRKVREGVVEVFEKWEDHKAGLATADSAKGNKETGSHVVAAAVSSMHPRCTPQTARVLAFLNRLNGYCTVAMGTADQWDIVEMG
ncbi:hypothetical protein IFM51744_11135 [Aspergillus udagawae]|nr:hypothetical protein IFM51744_11135 [Aspergillus udagawae]